MKRQVRIELTVKGLTPEELGFLWLAIEPAIDNAMEFLGCEVKGDNE